MVVYENYIYLTICEVSFNSFKTTRFSTYLNYCKSIKQSINSNDLTKKEMFDINEIFDNLDKIYSLSYNDIGKYILNFFSYYFSLYISFISLYMYMLILRNSYLFIHFTGTSNPAANN